MLEKHSVKPPHLLRNTYCTCRRLSDKHAILVDMDSRNLCDLLILCTGVVHGTIALPFRCRTKPSKLQRNIKKVEKKLNCRRSNGRKGKCEKNRESERFFRNQQICSSANTSQANQTRQLKKIAELFRKKTFGY